VSTAEPTERGAPLLAYAGFWPRAIALLIDLLLVWWWSRFFRDGYRGVFSDPIVLGRFRVSAILIAATVWAYFILTTKLAGGTLGKRAMRLRVVTTDFGRPDWLTVLFREVVGRIIVAGTLFIGYLWAAFDRRKQGWHDKIADTLVVKKVTGIARPDPWDSPRDVLVAPS
jgi:uncharacterized RDD family membrane protein YckC